MHIPTMRCLFLKGHLTDEKFLALNGTEIRIEAPATGRKFGKVVHLCLIGLEPHNITQPCWHRSKYPFGNAVKYSNKVKFDESKPDWERVYSHDGINAIIKECRDNGFFVTYNHLNWSLERYPDYMGYEGMHALKICNYNSVCQGYDEHNPKEYDDMLCGGKRVYCIASDDAHMRETVDAFGGFTMIKAEKLEYKTVTDALMNGDFYASEGPIINELWYEDGKVHINFEPAREAFITKPVRSAGRVKAQEGELVTEAVFDVEEDDGYFRITVEGADGKRAYTNAYFTDELFYFIITLIVGDVRIPVGFNAYS